MLNIIAVGLGGFIGAVCRYLIGLNPQMLLFLTVGVCGGFTTFSTFALEIAELIKNGNPLVAFAYMLGSVIVGVGVIFAIECVTAK